MASTIWAGQTLRVNLTSRKITIVPTADYTCKNFGGRGLGAWVLFREVEPEIDAYDPQNIIVFSAGPLVGTMATGACRLAVTTKNPLTGGLCAANAGGHFAPELKFAGFDNIIIAGRADRPVYLWLEDGRGQLLDAQDLWGLTVGTTAEKLMVKHRDDRIRVAAIGSAGENLVRGACIIVDGGRAAGRGGPGAVMGSKNLKAIAVRGTNVIAPADPVGFAREARRCRQKLLDAETIQIYRDGGSMRFGGVGGPTGDFPQAVKNYDDEYWPRCKSRKVYETALKEQFEVRRLGCFNCADISCSHFYRVDTGPYVSSAGEGLQINSTRAFGSNLDIDYAPFVIAAHNYCSEAGLDVDMAAACLGWAFEAYARGHISAAEANGLSLTWGNHRAAMALLKAIVNREGFGNVLAEGVKRAAATLGKGSEEYALHVKGADLNEASMRPYKAWALGIVLSTHGGGHLNGSPPISAFVKHPHIAVELFNNPRPGFPGEYENQAEAVVWFEHYKAVIDMLGVCYFTSMWLDAKALTPDDYAALLSRGTGCEYTGDQLMRSGEQVHNLQKAFNTLHAGFTRADDRPPRKLTDIPARSGPFTGEFLDREKWEGMLDEYYLKQGWDIVTGWQTKKKLKEINLEEISTKLEKYGKI